jgi:hypothetical protein
MGLISRVLLERFTNFSRSQNAKKILNKNQKASKTES